jgi:diguanylate cyclase (GGDEF)-like protein
MRNIVNLQTLPFEKFSEQQTHNLWRGAWVSVLTVVALNLLVGHPRNWVWIGLFAVFTFGLQHLSRWNVYVAAMLHFISTLMITALTVSDPSGLVSNVDPALVFGTVSIPTVMSVSVFFGGLGSIIAALTGVLMLVLMKTTDYWLFAGFQIVSIAFFGFAIYNVIRQLERAKAALERAAMVDALTNLENRRALEANFDRYTALADRRATSLMMTSWDLNDLKRINDSRGHVAGDAHLQAFADALRLEARAEDAFFRVGGDEFIGLHLGLENGTELIERVRTAFPSVAAGWTTITGDLDAALIASDRMMYTHKAALKSNLQNTQKENPYVVA